DRRRRLDEFAHTAVRRRRTWADRGLRCRDGARDALHVRCEPRLDVRRPGARRLVRSLCHRFDATIARSEDPNGSRNRENALCSTLESRRGPSLTRGGGRAGGLAAAPTPASRARATSLATNIQWKK